MNKMICQNKLPGWLCRYMIPLLLVGLFAYTGAAKLVGHGVFLYQLKMNHLPRSLAAVTSILLPLSELTVALILCFPKTRLAGLWFTTLFMLVFVIYVIVVLSGKDIPCSCGGVMAAMGWRGHLYFNIAFFLLSLLSLYYYNFLRTYQEVS